MNFKCPSPDIPPLIALLTSRKNQCLQFLLLWPCVHPEAGVSILMHCSFPGDIPDAFPTLVPLEKNQVVPHNPFKVWFFSPACALAVRAFLAQGSGDVNSRWAHLIPSEHESRGRIPPPAQRMCHSPGCRRGRADPCGAPRMLGVGKNICL